MAETTPLGIKVDGALTDVKAAAVIPGTRELLENSYNDFLDAKQKGDIALDFKFDSWIRDSINMLKGHRAREIKQDYEIGKLGRAEFEALEEYRTKMISSFERCDPSGWGFDQYGIAYIQVENRHLFREKVSKSEMVTAQHRDIKIKTGLSNGIIRV